MNLIEVILKLLRSGDIIGRIASLLGIGQEQAGKAVSAAVPSLLAGLVGSASKPEGAAHLANVLSKQEPGLLDNLTGLLSQGANAGTGSSNPLSALLGGGGLGQMAGALSKFTGVGEAGMGKLLGMLSPIVLGVIGKQARGLDATGLTNLLAGQKANITSALPSGLGSLLTSAVPGLSGLLGSASSAASSAANAASHAARATSAAATGAVREVERAGSSMAKWIIPIILIILAAFLLPKMCRKAPDAAREVQRTVESAASALTTEGTKFVTDAGTLIKDATTAVVAIKDEASASAALPTLQGFNTKLADMKTLWAKLPASAQKLVGDNLRPLIAKLRSALQPVLAIPGVGPKLKPVADEMLRGLDGFAPSV